MLAASAALAQAAPRAEVASPDVYKVAAQNDKYRILVMTWQPGQRDQWHSHPVAAVYFITDCALRGHYPDGKTREAKPNAGAGRVQPVVESHWVENIGNSECRAVMFEEK
ncbi:MAG: hypothetical protein OEO84_15420 [Betaproteobacteria bacterium]|nr:hypothetical protein [Betaproteobacteria bacterium]MDH5536875.1 hypothetical protein [Betaproteobacteria bacterium]